MTTFSAVSPAATPLARTEASVLLDISPLVSAKTAVFPGDVAFERKVSMAFGAGDHLALSSIHTTLHIGSHADAPSHYGAAGGDIAARPLARYFGPAQVVRVHLGKGARIYPRDLAGVEIAAPRVLFRTDSFTDPDRWHDDFNALSPELVTWLVARGVVTIGIDTPSVDPAASKALEAHAALLAHDVANLEGLVLSHVEPGLYGLAALPLRLDGAEAAPVRAVLFR